MREVVRAVSQEGDESGCASCRVPSMHRSCSMDQDRALERLFMQRDVNRAAES